MAKLAKHNKKNPKTHSCDLLNDLIKRPLQGGRSMFSQGVDLMVRRTASTIAQFFSWKKKGRTVIEGVIQALIHFTPFGLPTLIVLQSNLLDDAPSFRVFFCAAWWGVFFVTFIWYCKAAVKGLLHISSK